MKRRSFRALLQVQSLPRGLSLHHLVDFSFRRGDHEGTPDVYSGHATSHENIRKLFGDHPESKSES